MSVWLQSIIDIFRMLKGLNIIRWSGEEMALTEDRLPEELWYDKSIPWLQMQKIIIETAEGRTFSINVYQNDVEFGLQISAVDTFEFYIPNDFTIYRIADLSCLPLGRIDEVKISLFENRTLDEVLLIVDSNEIRLKTGEVYEQGDGSFNIVWLDESIMLQLNNKHPKL